VSRRASAIRHGWLLLVGGVLVGCSGLRAQPEVVAVWKSLGSRQCSGGSTSVESLASQLRQAGVAVHAAACGHDGRMRPAVCGQPDGRIGLFDIAAADLDRATALGFRPRAGLPDATALPCP
jgi:hypothetical protein